MLDDGGEVDLDLGNYERFLDITLHRDNNITTGKIYKHVMDAERRGDYLGKTVQVVRQYFLLYLESIWACLSPQFKHRQYCALGCRCAMFLLATTER